MSDQDAFDRILVALYDAMLDDGRWPVASVLIDEACGLQGHVLSVGGGPQDDQSLCSFVEFYHRGQRRADILDEYFERYFSLDERVPRYARLPDSQLVHVTDLYTDEELKTSPIYNEILPRYSLQDSLNSRLVEPDGTHVVWIMHNPATPDGWQSPQVALLRGLAPHLRQFVRVRQALARAGALGATGTALLGNPRLGVISLDQHGRRVTLRSGWPRAGRCATWPG